MKTAFKRGLKGLFGAPNKAIGPFRPTSKEKRPLRAHKQRYGPLWGPHAGVWDPNAPVKLRYVTQTRLRPRKAHMEKADLKYGVHNADSALSLHSIPQTQP